MNAISPPMMPITWRSYSPSQPVSIQCSREYSWWAFLSHFLLHTLKYKWQQHIDLLEIFNEQTLDETTVLCLAEAAASVEISRYFLEDPSFMQSLENLVSSTITPKVVQKALKKLINRIYGWRTFEDALDNAEGDFVASSSFLEDISSDEFALGCWVGCMISREELTQKFANNPVPSNRPPLFRSLFQRRMTPISHEEFIMFVRALLGVSTVLSMLAWSDSLGNDLCCERTLNILVVWQSVNGYREVELLNFEVMPPLTLFVDTQPLSASPSNGPASGLDKK